MSKLPPVKRLAKEDFPEIPEKFIATLNDFMGNIVPALTGKLTFGENFAAQLKTLDITGNTVSATSPLKYANAIPGAPVLAGLVIVKVTTPTGALTGLTSMPYVDWTQDGDQVVLRSITGLTAKTVYRFTFLTFTG